MTSCARTGRMERSCCGPGFRSARLPTTRASGCTLGPRRRPTGSFSRSARARGGGSFAMASCSNRSAPWRNRCWRAGWVQRRRSRSSPATAIDHGVLALAGQYVGRADRARWPSNMRWCPTRIRGWCTSIETIRPALVFADDAVRYAAALSLPCMAGIEKIVVEQRGGAGCGHALVSAAQGRERHEAG